MKRCSHCKEDKLLSEFHKDKGKKDNLRSECKVCKMESARQHYLSHRTEILKRQKRYKQSYQEEIVEQQRTPSGREVHRRGDKKHHEKFPEKRKAHNAVTNTITAGKLKRPLTCESCFQEKFIEAHHPDYNKLLDVDWICPDCHRSLHRELLLV